MSDRPHVPESFDRWFASRGWSIRDHQWAMLEAARAGEDALLIAPTGGGKTLGGFLPSLVDLAGAIDPGDRQRPHALHTLYLSPLKALSVDVARNLMIPADEMGLGLRIETRTGDTPASKRTRQRERPPDILLTTPEQLALFCASPNAARYFCDLKRIIIDEIHALAPQKRGDLLSLGLATLAQWAPDARRAGLSATVADEGGLARWLVPQSGGEARFARIVRGAPGPRPEVEILDSAERIPWAGHSGRHALGEVYERIKAANMTLVFVNTRAQAEFTFQELWRMNDDGLAIALHHGSLAPEQRRKVEAAMASGRIKAVVCTSTLDLGIDWGDVDLVIQMGAPKGSARLIQRLGRSNHRFDEPSKALLAPTNRFEHLECLTAAEAVAENALDGEPLTAGTLDVLAQHIMGRACGEAIDADALFLEITSAAPYADMDRADFDRVLDLAATGGYALASYDRFRRMIKGKDGLWRARDARTAQRHRMNVGTIVESEMVNVSLVSSPVHGGGGGEYSPPRPFRTLPPQAGGENHSGAAVVAWGRSKPGSSSNSPPATPSCLPGRCCASKRCRRAMRWSAEPAMTRRKSRPIRAASFRFRPIWRRGCVTWSRTEKNGAVCPIRCVTGWTCKLSSRGFPGPMNCWSKPFRARPNIIWSATRLRGVSRTRRWACC